ncbi:orotidine 5'-phosphate decarboxylase [Ralstonia pickettii]|nr:orotidine 5'-phosphate decarboxylase [Ralstonia pickettii]
MKLQLALDRLSLPEAYRVINETKNCIDLIEIGTGVIKEHGMSIIKKIKNDFPTKIVLADMKTCDAGEHETELAFKASADFSTVMAFASDRTISDSLKVANKYGNQILIDLLGFSGTERIIQLIDLGAKYFCIHLGKDQQKSGQIPDTFLEIISRFPEVSFAVAGGINIDTLPIIVKYRPDILIVGSSITSSKNPLKVANKMKGYISDYAKDNK